MIMSLTAPTEFSIVTATNVSISASSVDPGENTDLPFEETVTPRKGDLASTHVSFLFDSF